jgi:hypothetical protein
VISNCANWITLLALSLQSVTPVFAEQVAQLVDASGSVTMTIPKLAPKPLSKGKWVENGVIVTTGDASKVVLKFLDGQIIALQSNSVFQVNDYNFDPADPSNGRIDFALLKGGLRSVTGQIGERSRENWKLETRAATVRVRGTDFYAVNYQGLYAQVNAGTIGLTNSAGTEVFTAGQTAYVGSAAAAGALTPTSLEPPRLFSELQAINLNVTVGGAAVGASNALDTDGTVLGIPSGIAITIGVGAAAIAIGAGGGNSATHH